MKHPRFACVIISIFLLTAGPAASVFGAARAAETTTESLSVTRHAMMLGGRAQEYTATAGFLPLKNDQGKTEANIFFVAYTQTGKPASERPVAFAFNGGPGAAALWLHLGGLGPKRMVMAEDGTALAKNPQLTDNEATWLDQTDLVFVDPVGTGFSRAAEGVDPKRFHEINEDIRTAARFVRLYVTQFQRWLSPVYLVGESYGATRVAGMAGRLQTDHGIYPQGIIMISSVIDFLTISPSPSNDLPYVLGLPSCTATAWYHKKLPPELQADLPKALAQAEAWARGEYLAALAKGDALAPEERTRIARKLAAFTGLPERTILNNRLRIGTMKFSRELLRDEGSFLGFMDGRVKGTPTSRASEWESFDPSFFLAIGPFVAAFNDYVRRDLKFETPLKYEYLPGEVHGSWRWSSENRYVELSDNLAQAMAANEHLKVFNAAGIYDLTTPYFSQLYSLDHLGLEDRLRGNLTFKSYPSGHQIYTSLESLRQLKIDAAEFLRRN